MKTVRLHHTKGVGTNLEKDSWSELGVELQLVNKFVTCTVLNGKAGRPSGIAQLVPHCRHPHELHIDEYPPRW